jgi:hypothetical protein
MNNSDKHTLVDTFTRALKERAEQGGGMDYAMGFLYSTLLDLNLQGYEAERLRETTATLHELIDKHNKEMEKSIKLDSWVPASGGTELPFKSRSGKRLQYVWQPSTGQHAYLDVDSDVILSDEEAEACLALY